MCCSPIGFSRVYRFAGSPFRNSQFHQISDSCSWILPLLPDVHPKAAAYKRPLPAHLLWFRIFEDTNVVMGHTRMTTQGSEQFNANNHPFAGQAGDTTFALAHNGVLSNDKRLRRQYDLPTTKIETDSYIAVQLLEAAGEISFQSLADMAEKLEGSFTISVMTDTDEIGRAHV